MRRCGVLLALVVVAAVGCAPASDPEAVGPPASGGLDPNSMPPPVGTNGACHDLTPAGGVVTDQIGAGVPALNGGSLIDGRYVLTRYEWYSANQLHTRTITLVVSGGGKYGQYLWTRDSDPEQRTTVNIATSASQIAMRGVCPAGQDLEWDRYGMTDAGLTLYSTRDNKAAFFARQ